MKNIFNILMEKGNPKLAIRYAKRIIEDGKGKTPTDIAPGTKVYELVEELPIRQMCLTKKSVVLPLDFTNRIKKATWRQQGFLESNCQAAGHTYGVDQAGIWEVLEA